MVYFVMISIVGIFYSLLRAAYIDLRTRILPNGLIVSFLLFGCLLHLSLEFSVLDYRDMLIGGAFAFALMTTIRLGASHFYKQDAFGLGDVKLLSAGGFVLGMEFFLAALVVGALAGIVHGLLLAQLEAKSTGQRPSLSALTMPAGPGFVAGILGTGIFVYYDAVLQAIQ